MHHDVYIYIKKDYFQVIVPPLNKILAQLKSQSTGEFKDINLTFSS